jgi:hypothetical protein
LRFVLACQIEVQDVEILSCLQNLTLNTFNTVNAIIQLMWSLLQRLGQLGKNMNNKCVYCDQIHWKLVFSFQFLAIFWEKKYFQISFFLKVYIDIGIFLFYAEKWSLVIVISQLILSDLNGTKVITISGSHCS